MRFLGSEEKTRGLSLVFLDIMMPGMTGIEVLEKFPGPRNYSVVAATGSVESATIAELQ